MRPHTIGVSVAALVLAAAIAVLALHDARAAARAWLSAFVLVSMIPVGSLALLLVHGISGGRWGVELAPVLEPAQRTIPFLVLAFVPIIVARRLIYHWTGLGLPHDVLTLYLNPVLFDLRTLIALAFWSVIAWTGAWRRPLTAGLGLVGHLIVMTFIPADWVLTLEPGSVSAGFGLGFGIEQVLAALAFVALIAQQAQERPTRDLAGMLVSALLGTVYFIFMAFLITWYGNIPDKVKWYWAKRDLWPLALLAFLVGAALPFLATLNPRVRCDPRLLRATAALVLAGIFLHVSWLTAPSASAFVIVPAAIASLLLAALLLLAWALLPRNPEVAGHG